MLREKLKGSMPGSLHAVRLMRGFGGLPTARALLVVFTSVVAGVTEALSMLTFVRAATAAATDDIAAVSVIGRKIDGDPTTMFVAAVGFLLLSIVCHVVLAYQTVELSRRVAVGVRRQLINAMMEAPWSFVAGQKDGSLQEAMGSQARRASQVSVHLLGGTSAAIVALSLTGSAILTSGNVALLLLGVLAGVVLVTAPLSKLLNATRLRASRDARQGLALAESTATMTSMAKEFRTFGVQKAAAKILIDTAGKAAAMSARARRASSLSGFLFRDVALLALILIVFVLHATTGINDGSTIAVALLSLRALGYAQQTHRALHAVAENAPAAELVDVAIRRATAVAEPVGTTPIEELTTISFADVGYEYEDGRVALAKASFSIESGTITGLVGPSGAGKSTAVELLLGLRRTTSGIVSVDGCDLRRLRRDDWSRLTAFVPQEPRLDRVSIAENIRFLRPWISDEDVLEAIQLAHVDKELLALPEGLETVIGPSGHGLSGGQGQRVVLARALAGRPRLLVLDEPTSALDPESERLIRQSLNELRGELTVVLIAHRPSLLEICDRVIHLKDGVVDLVESIDSYGMKNTAP